MAGLIDAVQKKGGLKKAADAGHDPADLTTSESAGRKANGKAGSSVITSDSGKTGESAGFAASGFAIKKARRKTNATDSRKVGKKGRRIGRPAGPDRTALTVRILAEIDDALTDAVAATGMSPQYIADDALRAWLIEHGYMARNSRS